MFVILGLDTSIQSHSFRRWILGSSPRMTKLLSFDSQLPEAVPILNMEDKNRWG